MNGVNHETPRECSWAQEQLESSLQDPFCLTSQLTSEYPLGFSLSLSQAFSSPQRLTVTATLSQTPHAKSIHPDDLLSYRYGFSGRGLNWATSGDPYPPSKHNTNPCTDSHPLSPSCP